MKQTLLSLLVVMTTFYGGYSQSQKKQCDLLSQYPQLFSINRMEFNGRVAHSTSVNRQDSTACYAALVNKHERYLEYILTNFADKANYEELAKIEDTTVLYKTFIEDLQKDTAFYKVLSPLFLTETAKRDSISFDKLLGTAVRFFNVNKLNEKGHYSVKVCVGINLMKETTEERLPQVEAFCFASIFEHYITNSYHLQDELTTAIRKLYKVDMGVEEEEKILRAQGALMMQMFNNENLRKSLKESYRTQQEDLPFVVQFSEE